MTESARRSITTEVLLVYLRYMRHDLFAVFTRTLESVGGTAFRCSVAESIALALHAADTFPGQPIVYTDGVTALIPSLPTALALAGVACSPARSLDTVLTCPLALSTGVLAIAETGSVITVDRELEQRAPSMLSTANIVFVPDGSLVGGLDEAGVWLRENVRQAPYVSFVTGPSRTADIERTLTIGVQGPESLTVVMIKDETANAT